MAVSLSVTFYMSKSSAGRRPNSQPADRHLGARAMSHVASMATAAPAALHLAFSAECNPVRLSWSLPHAHAHAHARARARAHTRAHTLKHRQMRGRKDTQTHLK